MPSAYKGRGLPAHFSNLRLRKVSQSAKMPEKMHDEMLENRKGSGNLEAGFAEEDGKAMRSVVFKMDMRSVYDFKNSRSMETDSFVGSCLSSHSYSCALSSTVRMSETRRFSASRKTYTSMTISMRLGCVCFMLRILRGMCSLWMCVE